MPPYGGFFFSLNSLGAAAYCCALSGLLSRISRRYQAGGILPRVSPAAYLRRCNMVYGNYYNRKLIREKMVRSVHFSDYI